MRPVFKTIDSRQRYIHRSDICEGSSTYRLDSSTLRVHQSLYVSFVSRRRLTSWVSVRSPGFPVYATGGGGRWMFRVGFGRDVSGRIVGTLGVADKVTNYKS